MKKQDAIALIQEVLYKVDIKDCENSDPATEILKRLEQAGMLPPSVKVSTPLGARIFFYTHEWEEDIDYDEQGRPNKDGPYDDDPED